MEPSNAEKNFINRIFSVEYRQAHLVAFSVGRVRHIPRLMVQYEDQDITNALCESWLVHARALCEFFLIHDSHAVRDFSARHYGWDDTYLENFKDLEKWWVLTSKHLLHFSADRTPDDVFKIQAEDLTPGKMKSAGKKFVQLFLMFISHLEFIEHEDHEAFVIAFNEFCSA